MKSFTMDTCQAAKLIASSIEGTSERGILLDEDGTILYMNPSASHFLHRDCTQHVTGFLVCDVDEWSTVKHCRVIMKNGQSTRNDRNISLKKLNGLCSCCGRQYYAMYVCSRHGMNIIFFYFIVFVFVIYFLLHLSKHSVLRIHITFHTVQTAISFRAYKRSSGSCI